jgi:hypothetical protein
LRQHRQIEIPSHITSDVFLHHHRLVTVHGSYATLLRLQETRSWKVMLLEQQQQSSQFIDIRP